MKWFKHDSNATLDAKLQKLKLKYGMEGYGLYWHCLESIARNVESHNLTFELEEDAELISASTNIHYERVQEMMLFMCELGLFENADGRITCLKMATRTDEYTQKLIRSLENVRTNSGACPDKVPPNRIEENRIDKNRLDKSKKSRTNKFVPPTLEEITNHIREKNYSVNPNRFFNHYESVGWMVGKNKMKSWPHALAGWHSREKDSQPGASIEELKEAMTRDW